MSTEEDCLDDFLDLLENGDSDGEENGEHANSTPIISSTPTPTISPPRKALQDLTYEDLFGSPEKKKPRQSQDDDVDSERRNDKSKVESSTSSIMAQLGSRPVQPSMVQAASNSSSLGGRLFDTSQLITDHYSRIRLFKTSIALYHDEGTCEEVVLRERNFGLQYVSLLNFPFWYRTKGATDKNFWTSGVLARKQPGVRKSAKGNEYAIWEVNDLKQLDKSWTIFLFSSAVSAPSLSEIRVGSLIDITTPSVLDSNKGGSSGGGGPLKLSINNSNQIRLVGTAKDFGFCQSKRKDGKDCTAVVNTWECCTCIHHASSELKKMNSGASGRKRGGGDKKPGVSFAHGTLFDGPPPRNHKAEGICTVNFGNKPITGISKKANNNNPTTLSAAVSKFSNNINMPGKGFARMELQGSSVCSELKRNSLSMGNASSISFKKENNQYLTKFPSAQLPVEKQILNLDPSKTRHLTERDRMILAALGSPTKNISTPSSSSSKVMIDKKDDKNMKEKDADDGESNKSKKTKKSQPPPKPICTAEIASRIVSNPTSGSLNFMKYLTGSEQRGGIDTTKEEKYNLHDTRQKEAEPISMTRATLKNMKQALDLVKSKGPIQKQDPNAVKKRNMVSSISSNNSSSNGASSSSSSSTGSSKINSQKKRGGLEVQFDFESEDFKKILNAKSVHDEHTTDLVQAEYFDKLVKKEAIENKLLNTYSIATNAVMCKTCKYVALGQSEYCKTLQHQIRVVKANKRFFKCKDCGNRTMSLDRLPKQPCKQCKSSNWLAAPVGKEKVGPVLATEVLSIRGHEEKFIGTSGSKMFLNLEVS